MTAADLSLDELLIYAGDGGDVTEEQYRVLELAYQVIEERKPVAVRVERRESDYAKRSLYPVHVKNPNPNRYFDGYRRRVIPGMEKTAADVERLLKLERARLFRGKPKPKTRRSPRAITTKGESNERRAGGRPLTRGAA